MIVSRMLLAVVATCFLVEANAQEKEISVSGTVIDREGDPIAGTVVEVLGTVNWLNTDEDGRYSVRAAMGDSLRFTLLGFVPQTHVVNGPNLDVQLSIERPSIEGIITTGPGPGFRRESVRQAPEKPRQNTIRGRLYNEKNELIEGFATVFVKREAPQLTPTFLDGHFEIDGGRDSVDLIVRVPWYKDIEMTVPRTADLDIRLEIDPDYKEIRTAEKIQYHGIKGGRVFRKDGDPVGEALVTLKGRKAQTREERTWNDGSFGFPAETNRGLYSPTNPTALDGYNSLEISVPGHKPFSGVLDNKRRKRSTLIKHDGLLIIVDFW